MSYQIKANYDQNFLLPPSLEEWIPEYHPVRFIREFVNQLDLKELGFKVEDNEEGRPFYSSDLLLKVWLYGYFNRVRSPRQLEKQSKENISLLCLTGMNYPDHNTIWRFWRNNKSKFRAVFRESVTVAKKLGLIDMTLNALDGTKIKAYSSNSGVLNRKRLEELLKKTDKIIERIESEIESSGKSEEGEGAYSLPEELKDKQELKKKISEALKELKKIDRENFHPEEKEARVMKTSGKRELSYNAQAVVDSKHQIKDHNALIFVKNFKTENGRVDYNSIAYEKGDLLEIVSNYGRDKLEKLFQRVRDGEVLVFSASSSKKTGFSSRGTSHSQPGGLANLTKLETFDNNYNELWSMTVLKRRMNNLEANYIYYLPDGIKVIEKKNNEIKKPVFKDYYELDNYRVGVPI